MIRVSILSVLLLWPVVALPQATSYADRSGTITTGGTAQVVLPHAERPPWLRNPEPVSLRRACGCQRRQRRLPGRRLSSFQPASSSFA